MTEKKYSLCITYPHWHNSDQYLFFRIADYNIHDLKFEPISFADNDIEHKIIGARPSETTSNLTVIREWETTEENRTFSRDYSGTVYEVVFPKELSGIDAKDDNKIRNILHTGITLDEYSGYDLLIVIGISETQFTTLYCNKNNLTHTGNIYKVLSNTSDLLHTLHYLEEFEINKSDILNTKDLGIILTDGKKAPTRYFYCYTQLPLKIYDFHLYNFEKYLPHYISKYLKKKKASLQLSDNDIKRIVSYIEEIINNYDQVMEYFSITGYNITDIKEILPKYTAHICQCLISDTDADKIISNYLLNSEDFRQKCLEIVRAQWFAEKNDEREAILTEIEELRRLANAASKKRDDIKQLQADFKESEGKLVQVNAQIEKELKEFSNNIVHNVGIYSVVQSMSGNIKHDSPIYSYTNIINGTKYSDAEILDKDDLEEALSVNLSNYGFKSIAFETAQLIAHCIFNRLPLVVSGNGMRVANTLSVLFDGKGTNVVNIPIGYSDLADITERIKSTSGSVVYVTGVFDGLSENVFNSIKGSCKDKILIIDCESVIIGMLSQSVWADTYFFDGDITFNYCENDTLASANVEKLSKNRSYKVDEIIEKQKLLKPFIEAGILSNTVTIQYSKLMIDTDSDIRTDPIILMQLLVNAKSAHKVDELFEIFESLGVNEKTKSFLTGLK